VEALLRPQRRRQFALFAGDVVRRKKPAPDIYQLASERLDVPASDFVVVEDSRNGLLAAKAAGMACLITRSSYTAGEEFREADWVVDELGDTPPIVTLQQLKALPVNQP
jgi:beta-phosphoglucomutase-like phosphatase (HAD superfamily)